MVTWCQDRRYKNYGCCWLRTKDTVKLLLCFRYMGLICMIFVKRYHWISLRLCHLVIKLGMALVVTGSGPDTPVPLAIASPIPSRSSWWRFSAGWTTVSALKGSQPLPGYLELNVWLIFIHFYDLCYTVSSRSGM